MKDFFKRLEEKERAYRNSFGRDITDPKERKRSLRHYYWLDHGILRTFWTNFDKVADGVYRSNHPHHARFEKYKDMGITTILNLRGKAKQPHYLFEVESCEKLGLNLVTLPMSARVAPDRQRLLNIIDAFDTLPRPFLMHCKSGADRTGLIAAIYLITQEGRSITEAKKQLSFRYVHLRRTATGILDHFLDVYEERYNQSPIPIKEWIRDEYDQDALKRSFAAKQAALKPWQGWF